MSAYEAILSYALDGEALPMTDVAESVFILVKPVLDSASKRAESGKQGGSEMKANRKQTASKPQANRKQTASKPQANRKQWERRSYKEGEVEVEVENDSYSETPFASALFSSEEDGFDAFWEAYPAKSGDIRQAYIWYVEVLKTGVTPDQLLEAVKWQAEEKEARYMGSAEKWLRNKGWTEKRPAASANKTTGGGNHATVTAADYDFPEEI